MKRKAITSSTPSKRSKVTDASMQRILNVESATLDGTDFSREDFLRVNNLISAPLSMQNSVFSQYAGERVKQKAMWGILKDQESFSSQKELAHRVEEVVKLNASKSPMKTRRARFALDEAHYRVSPADWAAYQKSLSTLEAYQGGLTPAKPRTPSRAYGTVPPMSSLADDEAEAQEGEEQDQEADKEAEESIAGSMPSEIAVPAFVVLGVFVGATFLPNHFGGSDDFKLGALAGLFALVVALLCSHGPIAQDQAYHRFADSKPCCGVPNFLNVVSNLGFLVVGGMGVLTIHNANLTDAAEKMQWLVFFVATFAIGLGSAFYHLHPTDATLVWDRLPMTVAFMSAFSLIINQYLSLALDATSLLWTLVAVGVGSIVYYQYFGDLRPYAVVAFFPLASIPFIMNNFESKLASAAATTVGLDACAMTWCLGLYGAAKVCEALDRQIYGATFNLVSGHTLKHVLATAGIAVLFQKVQTV